MERAVILGKQLVSEFLDLCNREQLCHEYSTLVESLDLSDGFRGQYFQVPHLLLKYAPETMTSTKNVFITEGKN
jgi:hypothetical protein